MNYIPVKLLKLRKHYGYSQDYLARVLKIDVNEYMAYENGGKVPDYDKCLKLSKIYHIDVDEIINNKDDKVTLHEIKKGNKDINYFSNNQDIKTKIIKLIRRYPIKSGACLFLLLLIIIVCLIGTNNDNTYTLSFENINRLCASDTTVVYIDNNKAVYGKGNNDNKQISDLPSSGIIKVCESKNYTFVLDENGGVGFYPTNEELEKEISKLKNIVDIACGNEHLVALDNKGNVYAFGSNDVGQCNVEDFENITKIFATKNGTILMDESGKLYSCGEFIGQSRLKNHSNILDVDVDDDNLLILNSNFEVEYESSNNEFVGVYKWKDVIDVACGNIFAAGLKKDGTVYIESDDEDIVNEVNKWTNIIAISSAGNCLVGYDGNNIYAVGDNEYLVSKKDKTVTLPQVSNVSIEINETINVSFDKVDKALGYKISLIVPDVDTCTYEVSSNETVSFVADNLVEGSEYEITISTIGDGKKYLDSAPLSVNFIYQKNEETNEDYYVTVDVDLYSMNADELEAYLKSIGINDIEKIAVECEDEKEGTVLPSVNGISSNQRYLKSELSKAMVSYNYCKIKEEENKDLEGE